MVVFVKLCRNRRESGKKFYFLQDYTVVATNTPSFCEIGQHFWQKLCLQTVGTRHTILVLCSNQNYSVINHSDTAVPNLLHHHRPDSFRPHHITPPDNLQSSQQCTTQGAPKKVPSALRKFTTIPLRVITQISAHYKHRCAKFCFNNHKTDDILLIKTRQPDSVKNYQTSLQTVTMLRVLVSLN